MQQTRVMKLKYCAKQSEWLLNGEKLSNVFFITLHKKSVFSPVSFPEWKMVMCEHNYLGYVYFHQFQLHFHVYILFEIFQMCCINILATDQRWRRLQNCMDFAASPCPPTRLLFILIHLRSYSKIQVQWGTRPGIPWDEAFQRYAQNKVTIANHGKLSNTTAFYDPQM